MKPTKVIIKTSDFVNTVVVLFPNLVLSVVTVKYAKRALDVGKNI